MRAGLISLRDRTGGYTIGGGRHRRTDRWRLIERGVRVDHEVALGEHLLTAHDSVGTDPDAKPRREVGTDERDDVRGDTVDDPGAHDTPSNTRAPELAEVWRRPR